MYITIMSNSMETDQARHFVGPDLDPNCLQCLSADDKSKKLMRRESILTLCMLGIHVSVVVCCLLFFKINFSERIIQELYHSVKRFGPRSGPTFSQTWSEYKLFTNFKVIGKQQKSPLVRKAQTCADPESFVRGGPTLTTFLF